jgi:DNA-binding winged helix-turn-helix (wHTH) protein
MPTVQEPVTTSRYSIGPWLFDSADGTLRGPGGQPKMEDRAARTLALLCVHRGEIVSQATILEIVWRGRQVSANSVAVVIADLRRALEDDARDPVHIETIAKRGYRLKADTPPVSGTVPVSLQDRRRWPGLKNLAAVVAGIGVITGSVAWMESQHVDREITVEPVRNDTGSREYRSLASAMSELLVNRIAGFDGVQVYRKAETGASNRLVVQSKLILWNGIPTLSMTSRDPLGHVVWSGMVMGPSNSLASKTIAELSGLQKVVR